MNRNELWKQINELDEKFEKNKLKRAIKTILFFAIAFFGIAYYLGFLRDSDFLDILGILVACLILAGIHFWINAIIFSQLIMKSQEENKTLESLRKQLSELENSKE